MQNKEIVRKVVEEAWNKGNLEIIDQHLDNQYVCHDAFEGHLNRQQLKETIRTYRTAFPDLKMSIDEIIEAGDKVVFRFTQQGTHKGSLMGLKPTGKKAKVTGIVITRFANGKMAEDYSEWDALGLLQAVGVVPSTEKLLSGAKPAPQPRAR